MMRRSLGALALAVVFVVSGCDCNGGNNPDGGSGGSGGATGGGEQGGGTGGGVTGGGSGGGGVTGGGTGGGSSNRAPVIDPIAAVTVDEGMVAQATVTATDPDGDPLQLTLTAPPAWASIAGNVITLAPTFADSGSYALGVQASDGRGGISAGTLNVTVNNAGQAPTWTAISPISMPENSSRLVNLMATDPDGQAVTFTLSMNPPAWATLTGSQLTLAPGFEVVAGGGVGSGTFNVFVEAHTAGGGLSLTSVVVVVANTNRAPTFVDFAATIAEGTPQNLALVASDADVGDVVSFSFAGTPPAFVSLSGSTLVTAAGFADAVGSPYTVLLRASDGDLSTNVTLTLTVNNVNGPPVFATVPPIAVTEGQNQQVTLSGTDPDSDVLTFRAVTTLPNWITLTNGVITLAPVFDAADLGPTYNYTFEVTDGAGHTVTQVVTVNVTNVNRAPTINALADVALPELATAQIQIVAADLDGEALSLTVTDDKGGILTGAGNFGMVGSFSNTTITLNPKTGAWLLSPVTVTVTVRDPIGATASTTFRVSMTSTNTAPPAVTGLQQFNSFNNLMPAGSDAGPGEITLRAIANDPQADNVKLEAEVRPVGDSFLSPGGIATGGSYFSGALAQTDAGIQPLVQLSSLPSGAYKWQVRAIDESGLLGPWVPFAAGGLAFHVPAQDVTGSVAINAGANYTATPLVSVNLALAPGAGATSILTVELSDISSFDGGVANIFPNSSAVPWTLPGAGGSKTVYVKATDNLLRTAVFSDTIVLDGSPPTIEGFAIKGGAGATNLLGAPLNFGTSDVGTGIALFEASNDGTTFTTISGPDVNWVLASGEGTKTVTLRVTDNAGNVTTATDSIILDTTPPNVTNVSINSGASFTTTGAISVLVTASDTGGAGLAQACLSESTPTNCVTFTATASVPFSLTSGDGLKVVQVKVRDAAGNESASPVSVPPVAFYPADSITLDTSPPTASGVSINGGAAWTTSTTVTVTLSAADSNGVQLVAFSNDGTTFGTPEAYVVSGNSFTLPTGDAARTVFVRVTDAAGNTSAVASDSIGVDTTPPLISSFSINSGDAATNSALASLHFDASDTGGSGLSTSAYTASNDGASFSAINSLSPATFVLTTGSGAKTVTLRVTDVAGNVSSATDGIAVDNELPTLTAVVLQGGRSFTNQSSISVATTAADTGGSGLSEVCIGNANSGVSETCFTYVSSFPSWALLPGEGTRTVGVRVKDGAGNTNNTTWSPSIIVDTTPPTLTAITVNAGASYTSSATVTVTATASDLGGTGSGSTVAEIAFSNDGTTFGAYVPYVVGGNSHTLATGEGTRTVSARVRDGAGNESTIASDAIIADVTPPTGTVTLAGGAAAINAAATTYVVSATDGSGLTAMCVRESSTPPAASDACFVTYSTAATPITLGTGDGIKTVYAWFKDNAGLVSAVGGTDTVVLDTTAPVLSAASLNSGASLTTVLGASMGFTASDVGGSGLSQVCISSTPGSPQGGCVTYANPASFTLAAGDGLKTVYVQVRDVAGNLSAVISDSITLDTAAPTGAVTLSAGVAAINGTATSFVVSASDTNSVTQMCVRESPSTQPAAGDSCFVTYSTASTAVTLSGGDGTKTLYAWFKDAAGLVSASAATDTVVVDTVAPVISAASLNSGVTYATALGVSMGFSASDPGGSGLGQVCTSSTPGSPQSGCVAYANPAFFTMASGDEAKTIYVQVRDVAGNLSTVISDDILLDTTAPAGSVTLSAGVAAIKSTLTAFVVAATDLNVVTHMCVRESPSAQPAANDACFVAFTTASTAFTLTTGDGTKTVYAWFKDSAGLVSTAAASDTVVLDTVAPALSAASLNSGAAYTSVLGLSMGFTASDSGGSGLSQVCTSTTPGSPQGGCVTYANPASFSVSSGDGAKTVYVQVSDVAGNLSAVLSDGITLDTTAPTGSVTLSAGVAAVNTALTTFIVAASDTNLVTHMCVRESPSSQPAANDSCFVAFSTAATDLTLTTGEGTKTVYAWFKDTGGLVSAAAATDTVVLDTVGPSISAASLNGGAASTNQLVVSMGFTASDTGGSGLSQVCTSDTPGSPQGGCVTYANPAAFTLSSVQGTKTVYVQVRDTAGNLSAVVSDTIDLNTNGPVGTLTLTDTSGTSKTAINTTSIGFQVSASSGGNTVTKMCVRESAAVPTAVDACFVTYSTSTTAFTLTTGDATKTVYAWFLNDLGTVSGGAATDTIVLDTVAPTLSAASLNASAAYTSVQGVSMGFTASDTGSGLSQVCTSTTPGSPQGGCVAYVNPASFSVAAGDGAKTVYVQVSDMAGNLSSVLNDSITLDTAAPTGSVTLSAGVAAVNAALTTFIVAASDTNGVTHMCVRESPATQPAANDACFVTFSTAATALTLTTGDGTKTVYAWFKDAAGLVSAAAATDTVVLDTVAPSISAASLNSGSAYATALGVSMGFTASDSGSGLSQVCMSSTPGSPQGGCAAYANPAAFTLASGDGAKTVYLQVRDVAGNLSTVLSDDIIFDTTGPTGSVTLSAGAAAINTGTTNFTVTASDTNGVTQMCVRESPSSQPSGADSCFVAYSISSTAVTLSTLDGTKTLYAWFKDSAGLISAVAATDTVIVDTVAPSLTLAALNGGASLTSTTAATMDVTASDTGGSGLTQICMSTTPGSPQSGCITYADPADFTLSSGDGSKTVYVQVKDAAGNLSAVMNDAITLDTIAPTGTVSIASAAVAINAAATTFTVSASDTNGVQSMCVRESPASQPAANDSCFVTYTTASTNITLTTGDGTKTVYAWFKDNTGLVSAVAATDTIILDTVAPALSAASLNTGAALTTALAVSMGFTATDTGGSGLSQVCMSSSAGSPQGGCVAYASPASFTLAAGDGTKTVYVQVRDVAGNLSTVLSDTIILDTAAPSGTVTLSAGAVAINSASTTYVVSASDTNGVAAMCVRESPATQPAANDSCFVTYSTSATAITLGAGDGTKVAYAWFRDTAGLVSASAASDAVTLDTVAPTISAASLNSAAAYTAVLGVSMGFTATDIGGSGLSQVCTSTSAGSPQGGCVTYASPASFTLPAGDGSKTVYVQVKDVAGNLSAVLSDSITLDTGLPSGTVTLSGGAVAINTPGTTYVVSGSDTFGVAKMCARESPSTQPAANDSCFVTYSVAATAISLGTGDGTKTVYAWFLDNADNVSAAAATDTVILDTVAPSLSAATLNSGLAFTNSTTASMDVVATDATSGLAQGQICRSSTAGATQGGCVAYADPVSATLAVGDGLKTIYVQVIDAAGNRSAVLSDTITLDTVIPTLTSISVAGGATYANSTTVQVTAVASDTNGITDIAFSNDGSTWGSPIAYVLAGNTHTLSAGDGVKTVTARVRDPATNTSVVRTDTITLDATSPTGTVVINAGATYANATAVNLTLTNNDGTGSGVTDMCIKTVNTAPTLPSDGCWETYATPRNGFDLGATQGARAIYVWFLDAAGNISAAAATDSIFLDTVVPGTMSAPTCTGGHRFIDCTAGTSTESGSGLAGYELGYSYTSGSGYTITTPVVTTPAWTITGLQNNLYWYTVVRGRDNAGNVGTWSAQASPYTRYPFTYEHREPTSANLAATVAIDANIFVAVGNDGFAARTANGWVSSSRLDVLIDGNINSLAKDGDGDLYAVGQSGNYSWGTTTGSYWTKGTINDTAHLHGITEAASTTTGSAPFYTYYKWFVAVGEGGKILRGARSRYFVGSYGDLSLTAVTNSDTRILRSVALTNSGSYLVAVGDNGAILRSTNNGTSWSVITPPTGYTTADMRVVVASPTAGSNNVYIGTVPSTTSGTGSYSVLLYDASGTTPTPSTGFTGISVRGMSVVLDGSGNRTFFLTGNALNATPLELSTPKMLTYSTAGGYISETIPSGVTAAGRGISAFYSSTDSFFHVTSVGLEGQISADTNWAGGAANVWDDRNVGGDYTLYDIDASSNADGDAVAGGFSGYLIRTTTGSTWYQVTTSPSTTQTFNGVAVAGTTSPYTTFAVGTAGVIYTGTTGSGTATAMTSGTTVTLRDISCFSATDCYAVGDGRTIRQYNGTTWSAPVGTTTTIDIYGVATYLAAGVRRVIVVGGPASSGLGGKYMYYNGTSWFTEQSMEAGTTVLYAVAANGTGNGVALALSSSYKVFKSTNHGQTWAQVSTVPASTTPRDITWGGGTTWYISSGNGQIFKSTNDGTNWTSLVTGAGAGQTLYGAAWGGANASYDYVYACGVNGTVLRSLYGGE